MDTPAQKRAKAKYQKKMRETGKIKKFTTDVETHYFDVITNFCQNTNISKAELLRRISNKIENGETDFLK